MARTKSETTMTMTVGGKMVGPFTPDDLTEAAARGLRKEGAKMKDDDDFRKHNQQALDGAEDEIRGFIERFESLAAEKQDRTDDQGVVMAEAKARGYNTKVMRRIIAIRKLDPAKRAEEEAVLDIYLSALGMD